MVPLVGNGHERETLAGLEVVKTQEQAWLEARRRGQVDSAAPFLVLGVLGCCQKIDCVSGTEFSKNGCVDNDEVAYGWCPASVPR